MSGPEHDWGQLPVRDLQSGFFWQSAVCKSLKLGVAWQHDGNSWLQDKIGVFTILRFLVSAHIRSVKICFVWKDMGDFSVRDRCGLRQYT